MFHYVIYASKISVKFYTITCLEQLNSYDSEISKLNRLIVIALATCSDTVEDSVKLVHLQEF